MSIAIPRLLKIDANAHDRKHRGGSSVSRNPALLIRHGHVALRWSLEQIAAGKKSFPEDRSTDLSHESNYTCLYVLTRGELKKELAGYLRQKQPARRSRTRLNKNHRPQEARRLTKNQKFLAFMNEIAMRLHLRPVVVDDIEEFFRHQVDPIAYRMAAFTATNPSNREEFEAYWQRRRTNPSVIARTIEVDGKVVGHVVSAEHWGEQQVAYWIDREHWGRGIATAALARFVGLVPIRPLVARAVKDNIGSIRVLQKCGFEITGAERGVSILRLEDVDEVILTLNGDPTMTL